METYGKAMKSDEKTDEKADDLLGWPLADSTNGKPMKTMDNS